jgi:hypothetical protein
MLAEESPRQLLELARLATDLAKRVASKSDRKALIEVANELDAQARGALLENMRRPN